MKCPICNHDYVYGDINGAHAPSACRDNLQADLATSNTNYTAEHALLLDAQARLTNAVNELERLIEVVCDEDVESIRRILGKETA